MKKCEHKSKHKKSWEEKLRKNTHGNEMSLRKKIYMDFAVEIDT